MKKLIVPLFCVLLAACSERELPQQNTDSDPLSLEVIAAPSVVNPGGLYQVSVRIQGGSDVDSVLLEVISPDDGPLLETFGLFDDGGAVNTDDGDQVAFDGIFSQQILWAVDTGSLQKTVWRFQATDSEGTSSEPVERSVDARENAAPVLLKVETPDSLPSGFEGEMEFKVEVADSNGSDDIAKVMYAAYQNNALNFEMTLESTDVAGVYVQKMDRLFAAGKKGIYNLQFKAVDNSGAESEIVEKQVNFGNNAPRLLDFVHADSVQQPEDGLIVAFLTTVLVEDDQSLIDVMNVKMDWKKPDGTFSSNSPFELFDNGLPWNQDFEGWDDGWRGDENIGDGVYSITGIFDPSQPIGDYELTFYVNDFAGNQSERITRIVTFYPREGN
jgi:hypothetical protein